MLIFTIGDILGGIVILLAVGIYAALAIKTSLYQSRCKHDGGVNETQACDAICRKCGKNLGFIGSWRERK